MNTRFKYEQKWKVILSQLQLIFLEKFKGLSGFITNAERP